MRRALFLFVIVALLTGCRGKSAGPSVEEQRETAILASVGDFKTELVTLSKTHPELIGVGQFDHTHHGFTFVNENVKPPIYIALCVEDGSLSEMQSIPVSAEELPDAQVVCALQVWCEGRPEIKAAIEKLYVEFKKTLAKNLAEKSSNKPDPGDG